MVTEKIPERPKLHSTAGHESVSSALDQLVTLTQRLRSMGVKIVALAAVCLGCVIVSISARSVGNVESPSFTFSILGFAVIGLPLFGLVYLFLWDRIAKDGRVLYEEISDELEWKHRTFSKRYTLAELKSKAVNGTMETDVSNGEPSIEVRVALRNFLHATTLPFIPNNFSGMFYALYFIACAVILAVVVYLNLTH